MCRDRGAGFQPAFHLRYHYGDQPFFRFGQSWQVINLPHDDMNDQLKNTERPRRIVLWAVFGMSLVVSVIVAAWPDQIRVFSDTAHYMSTARMIRDGNGIQSELVYYDEQAISGNIPAPQTVFPPGYPIATAAFSRVTGLGVHQAGRVICLMSYAAIAPLILLMAIGLGLRDCIAVMCAAVWWCILSGWVHVWCYSSDMPFIVLTLISLLFYLNSKEKTLPLIGAGISAALAVSVRYTGVFLGITYGVVLLHRYREELFRLRVGTFLRSAVVLIGPAFLTTVGLFLRNQSHVGSWSGGNNYSVEQSYAKVAKMFLYSIGRLVGFSIQDLRSGNFSDVLFAVSCGVVAVGIAVLAVRRVMPQCGSGAVPTKIQTDKVHRTEIRHASILLYVPISMLLLVYLHKTRSSGIASRLILPTFPLMILGIGIVFQQLSKIGRKSRVVALIVAAALLVSVGTGQAEFMTSYRAQAQPSASVGDAMTVNLPDGVTLRHFLTVHCDTDNSLFSSLPKMTNIFVERPNVGLPVGFYNSQQRPWTVRRVRSRVDRFDVRYVLFVVKPDQSPHGAEFFSQLQEGNVPAWLKVVHHEPDRFTLYEVADF